MDSEERGGNLTDAYLSMNTFALGRFIDSSQEKKLLDMVAKVKGVCEDFIPSNINLGNFRFVFQFHDSYEPTESLFGRFW